MNGVRYAILALCGIIMMISCDLANNNTQGSIQVFMTDAPANYESVVIDIEEIRIHENQNAGDDEDGWRTIRNEPLQVDLLNLTNGNMQFLGETDLDPGTYNQIRLVLGDQNLLVMDDGQTVPLTTPSAQESGLKLDIDTEVESGINYILLLDFDASRSIVEAGNSGQYLLQPVIRSVNLTGTGAINGTIEPADALPWVYAIADSDTIAGTKATDQGDFMMIGLPPDSYQVSIEPTGDVYNMTVISDVEVTAPDTTQLETINLDGVE